MRGETTSEVQCAYINILTENVLSWCQETMIYENPEIQLTQVCANLATTRYR